MSTIQPPKDRKEIKEQKIIGETAPDKTIGEKDMENVPIEPKQEQDQQELNKEELTNADQKITNTDEKNDSENIN